jgi:excisionase family DNA binding protein
MPDDDLIGATEAARILDVDKSTLTRWAAAGRIASRRVGRGGAGQSGTFVFRAADVEALALELTAEQPA